MVRIAIESGSLLSSASTANKSTDKLFDSPSKSPVTASRYKSSWVKIEKAKTAAHKPAIAKLLKAVSVERIVLKIISINYKDACSY